MSYWYHIDAFPSMEVSVSHTIAQGPRNAPQLSSLIRDPFVRRAFERAERDNDAPPLSPEPRNPVLTGGAAMVPA